MKSRNIIQYSLIAFLVILSNWAFAQHPNAEKTIEKTFNDINSSTVLSINNKYGDINISTSKQQKTIEVKIVIEAWHPNQGKAEDILSSIKVQNNISDNTILFTTITPSSVSINNKKGFKITYNVTAPEDINLDIDNKYGSLVTESINGSGEFNVSYGSFIANELNGKSNSINISYSSCEIDFIENAEIRSRYLGKLSIGQVNSAEIDDKYGNINIGTAGDLIADCAYSNLNVDILRSTLQAEADYGSVKVNKVATSFKSMDIDVSYGSAKIDFDPDVSFQFNASVKYGSFKSNLEGLTINKQIEKNTSAEYSGYNNEASSDKTINVRSAYGSIKFN
ncbi:DUF4097 family beta strand repeat-containing protein [Flammeovirga kamogawensis]|uniref:DUF4097 family beta strand repeat protein n=1 Tax=Flammeovirga kamogawensis TaxID=373891 RepID=A0ABX8GVT4_9BACT|nr:DUF4097 family beta strand repeat-containing protein [Flammeovirga kamogawensis]MBB6461564.1 hypothetical protein [Flammeovirga kamogawensis]QWG07504.1 DUF4097 family beta strand repeat protein [Flammeovirga kamogawensis]TRX69317.1 hypothetical protein EO216_14735 [Flammeovirga kamogawensis]